MEELYPKIKKKWKTKEELENDLYFGEPPTQPKTNKSSQILIDEMLKSTNIITVMEQEWDIFLNRKSNGSYQGNCPFPDHADSTPSFYVYPEKDIGDFFCWGCHRGGTLLQFIQHMEGVGFVDALRRLAILTGYENITTEDRAKYANKTIEKMINDYLKESNDIQLPGGMNTVEFLLAIAECTRDYEKAVEYNEAEISWVDSLYEEIDQLEESCDFIGLTAIWKNLTQNMQDRLLEYRAKSTII